MLNKNLIIKHINGKDYIELCKSDYIFDGKGRQFIIGDDIEEQIAVFRVKGELYCLSNICPHRHQDQMHNGIITNMNVMCPAHGWTYSLTTGENVIKKQGIKSLNKYEVFEQNGFVYIEIPKFNLPVWRITHIPVE
jgi:nitrite reductase/ring-hydroxylating ferredoxin subunit